MKKFNLITVMIVLFAVGFLATSCGGGEAKTDGQEPAATEQTDAKSEQTEAKSETTEATEKDGEAKGEEGVDKSGKEYTSAYVCPMHCEGSGSAEPGKCPKCGMDYVKNEDAMGDGHEEHNH